MKREVIDTDRAPHTGLPYAQAVRYGDLVFVAGQVALDPKTNQPSGGDIGAQTKRVLDNIKAILDEAGTSLDYALDSLVFLKTMSDFAAFNDAYRTYFPKDGPPRTTVQASMPRQSFLVEIRIIAGMPE
jgi:2-iminobutanoate/2-iminopropanoate deaminase